MVHLSFRGTGRSGPRKAKKGVRAIVARQSLPWLLDRGAPTAMAGCHLLRFTAMIDSLITQSNAPWPSPSSNAIPSPSRQVCTLLGTDFLDSVSCP